MEEEKDGRERERERERASVASQSVSHSVSQSVSQSVALLLHIYYEDLAAEVSSKPKCAS